MCHDWELSGGDCMWEVVDTNRGACQGGLFGNVLPNVFYLTYGTTPTAPLLKKKKSNPNRLITKRYNRIHHTIIQQLSSSSHEADFPALYSDLIKPLFTIKSEE